MLPPRVARRCRRTGGDREKSASFLKKRSKKLLSILRPGAPTVVRTQVTDKSFLVLFFKKELLSSF
jgi:hypothetical protein